MIILKQMLPFWIKQLIILVILFACTTSFYQSGDKKYWMCCCISHKENKTKTLNMLSALVIEAPNKQLADKAFRLYVNMDDHNTVISKDAYLIWEINDDITIKASDIITLLDK